MKCSGPRRFSVGPLGSPWGKVAGAILIALGNVSGFRGSRGSSPNTDIAATDSIQKKVVELVNEPAMSGR